MKNKIKDIEKNTKFKIRSLYRTILVPSKEGFRNIDLGIPSYGKEISLDQEVYDKLKAEIIFEKLSSLVIVDRYLKNDYVSTKNIFESLYSTPGKIIIGEEAFKNAIKEGVSKGTFGVGKLENGKPMCKYFNQEYSPTLEEEEVIIKKELCEETYNNENLKKHPNTLSSKLEEENYLLTSKNFDTLSSEQKLELSEKKEGYELNRYEEIDLRFPIQVGKISEVVKIINNVLIKEFKEIKIYMKISVKNGRISKEDYENKIKEHLLQIGIKESEIEENLK